MDSFRIFLLIDRVSHFSLSLSILWMVRQLTLFMASLFLYFVACCFLFHRSLFRLLSYGVGLSTYLYLSLMDSCARRQYVFEGEGYVYVRVKMSVESYVIRYVRRT